MMLMMIMMMMMMTMMMMTMTMTMTMTMLVMVMVMMMMMMMMIKLPICLIVNHCSGSPCANGGSCSNLVDGYKCSCIKGRFTGKLCEQGETTTFLV